MKRFLSVLQSGSTSVLGRAYGVDEAHPFPVPAGSGGVVDPLGIPAARRRGGGGGGEKLQGFAKPEQLYGGERGAARVWSGRGSAPPAPSPLYIGGQVGLGGPPTPQTHLGPAAKGGGGILPPQVDPP